MRTKSLSLVFVVTLLFGGYLRAEPFQLNGGESRIVKIGIKSANLEKVANVNIYLPPNFTQTRKYPVLYMLHGYSDDENKWVDALGINESADKLINASVIEPLIIVMPGIDNSFGLNTDEIKNLPPNYTRGRYEDFLMLELIPYVDKNYVTIRNKSGRYIGGLSMGGWAALHLAFKYDKVFSRVGGHSPALINDGWLYPDFKARQAIDPVFVAMEKNPKSLSIYIDCGDTDSFRFYEGCAELFKVLQRKGYKAEYHLNAGGHDDAYWRGNLEKYLLFYAGKGR